MPQVTVTLNGRAYAVACDPGEEGRIRDLAAYIDGKIAEFVKAQGQVGEARLLVLVALIIADELAEAREALRQRSAGAPQGGAAAEEAIAMGVENLAARIEAIAAQLETSQI